MNELIINSLNEMYASIKKDAIESGIFSITEISPDEALKEPEHLLEKYEINFDYIVKTVFEDSITSTYKTIENPNGFTVFFNIKNEVRSSFFIVSDLESGIENSLLTKCAVLAHELGHFKDFIESKNFEKSGVCKDLIKAEAFADIFAMKYFDSSNHTLSFLVKSQYAKSILERKNTSSFYASVHREILGYISESRLKRWKKEGP